MIIAKPKIGTLFSLGLFVILSLGLASFTAYHMFNATTIAWYQYLIVIILFPLGLGLAVKVVLGYKIIEIGKERIEVRFPVKFKKESHKLKDIERWKETTVKTATGTYKEVDIRFSDKKQLTLSYQEHTDYPKVVKYLKKRCARQMKG